MSYLAAFRSADGVVMSADTQETVGDEKVYVEKITIDRREPGQYGLVIGGAGRGELVDGFVQQLTRKSKKSKPKNLSALEKLIEAVLTEFYAKDVHLLPGKGKGIKFLISATCSVGGADVGLWRTSGARVFEVPKYAAIGYNAQLCQHVARRSYKSDLPLGQLVLLATYVVAISKSVAVSVGGEDTQVVVIRDNGIYPEPVEYIRDLEGRLKSYEKQITDIFLACADTSIHVHVLQTLLAEFSETTLLLHRQHIDRTLEGKTLVDLMNTNDPYAKRPVGSVITGLHNGTLVFEHDPEKLKEKLARFRWAREMGLRAPHYFKCVHCNVELEYKLILPIPNQEFGHLKCPKCGSVGRTIGKVESFRRIGTAAWQKPDDEPMLPSASQT